MTEQQVPESRVYRHHACGMDTVISGQPFEIISNPLGDMSRTWCNTCNSFFPMTDYSWSDSGEKITDYWARHSSRASKLERFLCSRAFLIMTAVAGLIIGLVLGYLMFHAKGGVVGVLLIGFIGFVGVFVAVALNLSVMAKTITRRVCGVSDTRVLT